MYIQMLRNYLAYFSQTPQIRNRRELCSLDVHCFPSVFLSVYFCLDCQICAPVQFFGKFKIKCKPSICLQIFPSHTENNVSHKYPSTLIDLLLCCIDGVLYNSLHYPSKSRQFRFCNCAAPSLITLNLKKGEK